MILGTEILLDLVKTQSLVEGLAERELTNPEGAGFDLRLGKLYKISGRTFLGITERETVSATIVAEFDPENSSKYIIKPGEFYLSETYEKVNIPVNITASITPRSTLYRSGIVLQVGNVSPGYSGGLAFGFYNCGGCDFEVELGARFVHIQFQEINGAINSYRGQWQGGRIVTEGRETQV